MKLTFGILVVAAVLAPGVPAAAADAQAAATDPQLGSGVRELWGEYPLRPKTSPLTIRTEGRQGSIDKETTAPRRAASPRTGPSGAEDYSESARRLTVALAAVAATGVFLLLLMVNGTRLLTALLPQPRRRS